MHRLRWGGWTLGFRLTLIMTILSIATASGITLQTIHREQQDFRTEQEQQAELMLDTLASSAVDYLYFLDLDLLTQIVVRLSKDPMVVHVRFYDAQGRVIADAHDRTRMRSFKIDSLGQQLTESDGIVFEWQPDQLIAGQAIVVEGQRLGAVSVGLSQASLTVKLADVRNQGFQVILAVTAIGILVASLFSRSLSTPIHDLVRTTERIAEGDLTQRAAVRGGAEIGTLASAFNRMTAQLQATIERIEHHSRDLEQRNRELLAVQAAGTTIASSLDLQHVLKTVAREMAQLVGAEACAISEWDQEADTVSVLYEFGPKEWLGEGLTEEVFSLSDYPLTKRVLVERRAQQVTMSQPDADTAELAYMQAAHIETLVMLPMVFQDRVVGLVEIMNWKERPLTDQEISLAQLLANQAASAIENARLYQKAQREIAQRQRAEEITRASLKEKEVLLKEVHHRVKNNLQIVSSLLTLQSRTIKDEQIVEALNESQNRVYSMAIIHETLYQAKDLARINFIEYTHRLAEHLQSSYGTDSQNPDLRIDVAQVSLSVDLAIACGLIINELVSNSLKYAFPDGREGEIYIGLRPAKDRRLILTVSDDGVGLPVDVEFRDTESLGLQLVTMLTEQLEGTVKLDRSRGTAFEITFRQ